MKVVIQKRREDVPGTARDLFNEGYALCQALAVFGIEAENEVLLNQASTEALVVITFDLPDPTTSIQVASAPAE